MNARLRLTMMAGATIVLLAILAFLLLSDPNAGSSQLPATRFAGAIRPESPPVRFALRDQDGELIKASALRGQPVIVAFMYTTCQNECPTIAQQIRGALDRLGSDVPVVAVSVDPANDTPASASAAGSTSCLAASRRCSRSGANLASHHKWLAASTPRLSSCLTPGGASGSASP